MNAQRMIEIMQMELHLPKLRMSRRIGPACLLALIGLGGIGLAAKGYEARLADGGHAAASPMTAAQVLKRAEPYLRALEPEGAQWTLSTENSDSSLMNFWNVACTDERGEKVAELIWSATRNRLVHIQVDDGHAVSKDGPIRTNADAIRSAERWLNVFGFSPATPHWHLKVISHSTTRRWIVQADSEQECVTFGMRDKNGSLTHLMVAPHRVSHL